MESFGLLIGHLLGDYILQNDWMAANKANPRPGKRPAEPRDFPTVAGQNPKEAWVECHREWRAEVAEWRRRESAYHCGHVACTIHCLLYTLAVWACSFWWLPWWGLAVCFFAHWPIDRFRLAGWWMRNVSGQAMFAAPGHPLFPWSVVVVDNTFHLLVLFVVGCLALR